MEMPLRVSINLCKKAKQITQKRFLFPKNILTFAS